MNLIPFIISLLDRKKVLADAHFVAARDELPITYICIYGIINIIFARNKDVARK